MNCSNCQASNPIEAKFCMSCGSELQMESPVKRALKTGFVSYGWVREMPEGETHMEIVEGVWHATHFDGGKPDKYMVDLFGSHQLPTPWTDETDKETVVREFAARNPHMNVS